MALKLDEKSGDHKTSLPNFMTIRPTVVGTFLSEPQMWTVSVSKFAPIIHVKIFQRISENSALTACWHQNLSVDKWKFWPAGGVRCSSSEQHECLYQISWLFMQLMLRYFSKNKETSWWHKKKSQRITKVCRIYPLVTINGCTDWSRERHCDPRATPHYKYYNI